MTPLTPLDLEEQAGEQLAALQARVDALDGYERQVAFAKKSWKSKPDTPFVTIRRTLEQMCSGNQRCVYCEDSYGDEIEHMRPKDLYPEQAYAWTNYVLACGPCNGPKNNQYAVLGRAMQLIDVTRKPKAAVIPPEVGTHALIDLRVENPLDLLWLDFRTGRYTPNEDDETSQRWQRAKYTIDILRLNERDALVRGRRSAISGYTSRLDRWVREAAHWDEPEKAKFREDFNTERYRSVWERMKRYRAQLQPLAHVNQLILAAPEVLTW